MSKALSRIVNNGMCHGCGGCVAALPAGAASMQMDGPGFLRPLAHRPFTQEEDATVEAVCSGEGLDQLELGRKYNDTWGPLVTVEVGHALDPDVRYQGSSGGVISAIAIHLLETNQIDFVLHTRASPNDPLGNISTPSLTRAEVLSGAGSRYAPSSPLADLDAHLNGGRTFAFIGKPCDVASLRRMALRDPRIDRQIPVMLSFFCAGVPSRSGAQAVLKELATSEPEVESFAFRGNGWPGLTRAVRRDGSEATMDYNSSWGTILSRHLQFRCKICPEGVGEFADVVCADAWHGKDGYPDFTERDGRGLVIARTLRGRQLVEEIVRAGKIEVADQDVSAIRMMQPYQHDRRRGVLARLLALRLKGRPAPHYRGLRLWASLLRTSPVWLLRNFGGTFRRVPIKGRIW